MRLTLHRTISDDKGTFGVWYDENDIQFAMTCERPPTGDFPCIPAGVYTFEPFKSPHNGDCFLCTNPPEGRSMIEVHSANVPLQLKGCIAPGQDIEDFNMKVHDVEYQGLGVTNSKDTMKKLLARYPDGFELEIIDAF